MLAASVCVFVLLTLSHIMASERAVVCYYGTWATYRYGLGKFDVDHINPNLCTHLIYAFVGIDAEGHVKSLDSYLDLPDDYGKDNFKKFNALKQKNPSLKTLLAVGGWNEGSAKYSTMAADPVLRKNFIDSALKMVTDHGFNGLDIDWEYPNRRDTVHGSADIDNFTTLLREIREVFDKDGLLLTAAVSAGKEAASQSYDIPAISQYLDIVNIMAYDMYGAWDPVTGHNAPLHKGEGDDSKKTEDLYTVDQALDYWIGAGCPPGKIALGVPLYGRTFTLTDQNVNGVRAPVSGAGIAGPFTATSGFMGYNEFCHKLRKESWTQRFDSLAKLPYAFKNRDWVSYDDTNSITAKIDYAKKLGITKVMTWSIETDDFHGTCGDGANPLLTAINTELDSAVTGSFGSSVGSTPGIDYTPGMYSTPGPVSTTGTVFTSSIDSTSGIGSTPGMGSSPGSTESSTTASNTVCNVDGFAANPGDCSIFYNCIRNAGGDLVPKEFKCPANLYWDQTILSCNYQQLVTCNA